MSIRTCCFNIIIMFFFLTWKSGAAYEVRKDQIVNGFWNQILGSLFPSHKYVGLRKSTWSNLPKLSNCPKSHLPPIPYMDLLNSMVSHEVQTFGNVHKRYLPPKFGLEPQKHLGSLPLTNSPIKVLTILPDRTVCIGAEGLAVPFPSKHEMLVPFLNVINSFIRFVNHQSTYPRKISAVALSDLPTLRPTDTNP